MKLATQHGAEKIVMVIVFPVVVRYSVKMTKVLMVMYLVNVAEKNILINVKKCVCIERVEQAVLTIINILKTLTCF